jgi:Arc/MetJ-type ribon-helix-helix transcriptional regulator
MAASRKRRRGGPLSPINVKLSQALLDRIEAVIAQEGDPYTRSDAIRDLLDDALLVREQRMREAGIEEDEDEDDPEDALEDEIDEPPTRVAPSVAAASGGRRRAR